jgi:hypothetical protein
MTDTREHGDEQRDDDLLEAQEGKGYGEDEGERDEAVESDLGDDDEQ